jgi:hypothetical protein
MSLVHLNYADPEMTDAFLRSCQLAGMINSETNLVLADLVS